MSDRSDLLRRKTRRQIAEYLEEQERLARMPVPEPEETFEAAAGQLSCECRWSGEVEPGTTLLLEVGERTFQWRSHDGALAVRFSAKELVAGSYRLTLWRAGSAKPLAEGTLIVN